MCGRAVLYDSSHRIHIAQKQFNFNIKSLVLCLAGIALLGVTFKLQALYTDFAEWPTYTHNRIDAFAWGILTIMFLKSEYVKSSTNFNKLQPFLVIIGLVILSSFLAVDYAESDPHELILRTVSPICWSLIIIGSYHYRIPYSKVFKRIALYSYNLYLWHFLFIIPIEHYFGTGLMGFAIYALTSGISAVLSTHIIENKFLRYRAPLLQFAQSFNKADPKHVGSSTKEAMLT